MRLENQKFSSKNQKSTTAPSPYRLMGMGLELGLIIGGLTFLGYLGDKHWGTDPWLALTGALVSTIGGCYNLVKEANRMPKPKIKKRTG